MAVSLVFLVFSTNNIVFVIVVFEGIDNWSVPLQQLGLGSTFSISGRRNPSRVL